MRRVDLLPAKRIIYISNATSQVQSSLPIYLFDLFCCLIPFDDCREVSYLCTATRVEPSRVGSRRVVIVSSICCVCSGLVDLCVRGNNVYFTCELTSRRGATHRLESSRGSCEEPFVVAAPRRIDRSKRVRKRAWQGSTVSAP